MNELSKTDLQLVVSRIPKDVKALMMETAVVLGGGFIRETIAGNKPQDIDLFGQNETALRAAAMYLQAKRQGSRVHTSANAVTLLSPPRMPVQFIIKWLFEHPEAVVSSFDFTVCQAIVYYEKGLNRWRSVVHENFYADLAARRLVYTFPVREEAAGGSMLRVIKFLKRGYNIQAPSLAGVVARLALGVNEDRLHAYGEDRERGYAEVVCGLLREVDPLIAIDGVDVVDEHEVVE